MGHRISTYQPKEILFDYDFDISKEDLLKIYPHMTFYMLHAPNTLHITITSVKCLHKIGDHYMRIEGDIISQSSQQFEPCISIQNVNLTDLYDCGEHIYNGGSTPYYKIKSVVKTHNITHPFSSFSPK